VDTYRNNALDALLTLEEKTYIWPDAIERKQIARRIKKRYKFPNCVGLIDGTLLPLAKRPLLHGENYLSRKKFYAVVMLVVCDDNGRILYYQIGWPGSVHDNRVWRTCRLSKQRHKYFSKRQYLLGDSAFTASEVMIPPFKATAGSNLSSNRTGFNTLLAKPRVKSEHCIGILKGRFPFLRNIRLKLASRADMTRLIDYVRGSVIMHNFLRTENSTETDWIEMEPEGEDDLEPESTASAASPADYTRRDELYFYLSELDGTAIN
jgi:DDE superfamily endonuclease